jgi:hypothetical protein
MCTYCKVSYNICSTLKVFLSQKNVGNETKQFRYVGFGALTAVVMPTRRHIPKDRTLEIRYTWVVILHIILILQRRQIS